MDNQQFQPVQNQSIWTIILSTIIITALIVGGGVWYWQKSSFEKEKEELQQQIEELESRISESEVIDTSDWQTYRNEEYGFEVKYPEDWILAYNNDKTRFSIDPENQIYDCMIYLTTGIVTEEFNLEMTPEELLKRYGVSYGSAGYVSPDFDFHNRVTAKKEAIVINELSAQKFTRLLDGEPIINSKEGIPQENEIWIEKGGVVYRWTGTYDNRIDDSMIIFDQILSTFKFTN